MKKPLIKLATIMGCVVVVASCLMTAGCIKNSVEIVVGKDGAGRIIVTQIYPREIVNQMNAQIQAMSVHNPMMGMSISTNRDPFFDLRTVKRLGAQFGPSVKFVGARSIDGSGARGYVALYSFKDINEVYVDINSFAQFFSQSMSQYHNMMEDDEEFADEVAMRHSERGEQCFEFRLTPGKFQIMCPPPKEDEYGEMDIMEDIEENDDEDEREEQMISHRGQYPMLPQSYMYMRPEFYMGRMDGDEAMERMLKGGRMILSVEMEGVDVKTAVSMPDPSKEGRFYLVNFDTDKILATEMGKKLLKQCLNRGPSPDALRLIAAKAGMPLIETNRAVTVEFK